MLSRKDPQHWSVNYEGGKIVEHALSSPLCGGYTNIQIAMDAPFLGKPAEESMRRSASGMRAERAFSDFDELQLLDDLTYATKLIATQLLDQVLVVQIARGKAAQNTEVELVIQALESAGITNYNIKHGYKRGAYFELPTQRFIMMNIGMFASLNFIIRPGQICIPAQTFDVISSENGLMLSKNRRHEGDLLFDSKLTKTHLLGIEDSMPFVTPQNYPSGHQQFSELVKIASQLTSD